MTVGAFVHGPPNIVGELALVEHLSPSTAGEGRECADDRLSWHLSYRLRDGVMSMVAPLLDYDSGGHIGSVSDVSDATVCGSVSIARRQNEALAPPTSPSSSPPSSLSSPSSSTYYLTWTV